MYFQPCHWDEIALERNLEGICGSPMCGQVRILGKAISIITDRRSANGNLDSFY
jgi:hypothetical protein